MSASFEGMDVNEAVMHAYTTGRELACEVATKTSEAAQFIADFDAHPDPSSNSAGLARVADLQRIRLIEKARTVEDRALELIGAQPVELFVTERGLAQPESPIFATFLMNSILSSHRGEQVRDNSLRRVRRFRGIVDEMDILSGQIALAPLNGSRTSINHGYYIATVLDADGVPLVRVDPTVRKGLERVTVFASIGSAMQRVLAH